MKEDNFNLLDELHRVSDQLQLVLPTEVRAVDLSIESKIPFKIARLQGSLLHRIDEFLDSLIDDLVAKRYVSVASSARSIMETYAKLFDLHFNMRQVINGGDLQTFDDYVMKAVFGGRDKNFDLKIEATNILNSVDKVSKEIKPFRAQYDRFSEMAHPNFLGVSWHFSTTDAEKFSISFGKNVNERDLENIFLTKIPTLKLALETFQKISDAMPGFIQVAEKDLQKEKKEAILLPS